MTPLEKAKQKAEQAKRQPTCKDCHKSERFENLLYCKISGKIILPQFEDICCCRGKRLEET
jgi:hypothetical protein